MCVLISLQVSPNDGLPAIVCNMCRTQLDTCQQFRDKAQRSQQKLQNFLKFANKLTGDPQVRELLRLLTKKQTDLDVKKKISTW